MEQELETRPERPRRRAWLGCLVGIVLILCAGGLALAGWSLMEPSPTPIAGAAPTEPPAATATAEVTASAEATSEPSREAFPPGRIAFVTERGQIGSVGADGGGLRTLTGESAFYLFPAWSPDGTRLAAIGSTREGAGVYLVADGDDPAITTLYDSDENAPIYLSWGPGGEQVSFIAQRGESLGLYLARVDGSQDTELLATGQPFYWDWSEEGERLLIHSGGDAEDARLTFVDVTEGQPGENLAAPGFFQAPGISQDGAFVAFASVDEQDARWLVVESQTGDPVQRVPHRGAVALDWSPTAAQVAFISPEFAERRPLLDYHGPLRLLDADSGETTLLVDEPVLAFFWAPDGTQIAYLTLSGSDQQREATAPGRFVRRGKGSAQRDEFRLELGLVDVRSGQTRRVFSFAPTDLFVRQFLPFFDQYALSHRLWSPDSSALVLPVQEGRDETIYVVPVDGGSRWPVAEGEVAFWSWE